jgi:DNA mismatch repair ATPase MutS
VLGRQPAGSGWRDLLPGRGRGGYSFTVADQDEAASRALADLASRGVSDTANAVAQATDHVRDFFAQLRAELGFCVSCLNLRDRLLAAGMPVCFPVASGTRGNRLTARGLYDAGLVLSTGGPVTGNDLAADGKQLIMITGANQGGKSTFLRAAGQAQLMMQAGMFTAAESFAASSCSGVFTHFKREEDAAMERGKLDEELQRMSAITARIRPGGLLLCNESFASTNEREGSEIARQLIRALTEAGIRIVFVTHLYDLAESCYRSSARKALFLRAQREPDGSRTFRLAEGEPLPTSYGEDLFRKILGPANEEAPV